MLTIQAPSDAQLIYIRNLTLELGARYPQAIASKTEAAEIIDALKDGTYDPGRYAYPFSMSSDDVPF